MYSKKKKSSIAFLLIVTMLLQIVVPSLQVLAASDEISAESGMEKITASDIGGGPELYSIGGSSAANGYISGILFETKSEKGEWIALENFIGKVKSGAEIQITFKIAIPDNENSEPDPQAGTVSGSAFTVRIPKEIPVATVNNQLAQFKNAAGTSFDLLHYSLGNDADGGYLTYTFVNEVLEGSGGYNEFNKNGTIKLITFFSADDYQNDTEKEIKFKIGEEVIFTIVVPFESAPKEAKVNLSKASGSYVDGKIPWTITVTPSSKPAADGVKGVTIIDDLKSRGGGTHTLDTTVGSVTFGGASLVQVVTGSALTVNTYYYDEVSGKAYFYLGDIDNTTKELKYSTIPDTAGLVSSSGQEQSGGIGTQRVNSLTYYNRAKAEFTDPVSPTGPKLTTGNADAQRSVTAVILEKGGAFTNEGGITDRFINWIIKVNPAKLTLKDVSLVDTLPAGVKLVGNKITVAPNVGASGEHVNGTSSNLTVTTKGDGSTEKFTFTFPAGENADSYTITYQTEIVDENLYNSNNSNLKNEVILSGKGIGGDAITYGKIGYGVAVLSSIIRKEVIGGYDRENRKVTWEIYINERKKNIDKVVVTDILPSGLEILDEDKVSFKLYKNGIGIALDSSQLSFGSETTDSPDFTYNLGNITDNSIYKLVFTSTVTERNLYGSNNNNNRTNKAYLKGMIDGATKAINESDDAQVTINSKVIEKSALDYDYVNRIFSWKLVVNQNKMKMKNANLEDLVNKYEILVENTPGESDNITYKVGDAGAVTPLTAGIPNAASYGYTYNLVGDKYKLTIYLPKEINDEVTFEFKTKINDDKYFLEGFETNKLSIVHQNKATLSSDDVSNGSISSDTSKTIENKVVNKAGDSSKYTTEGIIRWTVIINQNALKIENPVLEDILSSGLEYIPGSAKLYQQKLNADGSFTEIGEVTNDFLTVELQADKKILFKLGSQSDTIINEPYRLVFDTFVDDQDDKYGSSVQYNNKIFLQGTGNSNEESNQANLTFTQRSDHNFTSTGRLNLQVVKVDEDTSVPISGVKFLLFNTLDNEPGGAKGIVSRERTTDSTGQLSYKNLMPGIYFLQEIEAAEGYVLEPAPHKIIIGENSDPSYVDGNPAAVVNKTITLTAGNKKVKGNIQLFKVNDQQEPLQGAEFILYKQGDATKTPVASASSKAGGEVLFENIPYGAYIVEETKAPEGYKLPEPPTKQVEIGQGDNGKTVAYGKIINSKESAKISFIKVNSQGTPLADAVFTLHEQGKEEIYRGPVTSGADGKVEFTNIPFGVYTLKEITPPKGYKAGEPVTVTFKTIGTELVAHVNNVALTQIVNTEVTNSILLYKADDRDMNIRIPGVEFTLYKKYENGSLSGSYRTAESNGSGTVEFTNLSQGTYYIKETKAPANYLLSDQVITAIVTLNGDNQTLSVVYKDSVGKEIEGGIVVNEKKRGSIELKKIDKATKAGLAGAVFTLYYDEAMANPVPNQSVTSDKDGIVLFTDVEYGTYYMKETTPPQGYTVANLQTPITAAVTEHGVKVQASIYEVENDKWVAPPTDPGSGNPTPTPEPGTLTPTPGTPTPTPGTPTPTPGTPTPTPGTPTPTPGTPTPQPEKPVPTPAPITEITDESTPKGGTVPVPEGGTATKGEEPKNGIVQVDKDGKWIYKPNPGFVGKDKFTVIVAGPNGEEEILVEIEVEKVPLGTIDKEKGTDLPKTGETLHWSYVLFGMLFCLTGIGMIILRSRKKWN